MKKMIILAIVIVVLLVGVNSCFYIVYEDETAVVKTFSKVVSVVTNAQDAEFVKQNLIKNEIANVKSINEKGLHFKIPFIQSVEKFTSKYLTYQSNSETINAKDSRRIDIQMYAQYKIIDPVTFKLAVGTTENASRRMDELIYRIVIQSANSLEFNDFFYQNTLEDLLESKQVLLNEQLSKEYGLYISDIGIDRKSFPLANVSGIEEKMTLQIQKESEKLTAEGDSEYIQAQAIADREKAEVVSAAVEQAAIIKANADAEAIKIYQDSLNKDLDFYQFTMRMQIYKEMKGSTIFIDRDNDIFKMLNGYQ